MCLCGSETLPPRLLQSRHFCYLHPGAPAGVPRMPCPGLGDKALHRGGRAALRAPRPVHRDLQGPGQGAELRGQGEPTDLSVLTTCTCAVCRGLPWPVLLVCRMQF